MAAPKRYSRDQGRALYILRQRAGHSIRDAAALAGVTPRVIRCAEEGAIPRERNALLIAGLYGVDVLELWPLVEPPPRRRRRSPARAAA